MDDYHALVIRLGRIVFSIVLNKPMWRVQNPTRRIGGFITWDADFFASTLRVEWLYVNLDWV